DMAIRSIELAPRARPAKQLSSLLAGMTGGISGFVGFAALPIELPMTTTIMLRSIAETARYYGEDLSQFEARMACMEVFALGSGASDRRLDMGYYASRALLSRLASEASAFLVERGVLRASAPVVNSLLTEITARFGVVASERIAASAVPILGAIGGATINMIFMEHFQRVAQGHFTIRRLERRYGADVIRAHYDVLQTDRNAAS